MICANNVCAPLASKKAGQQCQDTFQCGANLQCNRDTKVCTAPPAIVGKLCTADADCDPQNDVTCNTDACPSVCSVNNYMPKSEFIDIYLDYVNCVAAHSCDGLVEFDSGLPQFNLSPEGVPSCLRDHCLKEAEAFFSYYTDRRCPAQNNSASSPISGLSMLLVLVVAAITLIQCDPGTLY